MLPPKPSAFTQRAWDDQDSLDHALQVEDELRKASLVQSALQALDWLVRQRLNDKRPHGRCGCRKCMRLHRQCICAANPRVTLLHRQGSDAASSLYVSILHPVCPARFRAVSYAGFRRRRY